MEEEDDGKLPSEIIGMAAVHRFAAFYEKRPDEIAKMKDACLIRYCEEQEFNRAEYSAFKEGVATVMTFFLSCLMESNKALAEKTKAIEKDKKKAVGKR